MEGREASQESAGLNFKLGVWLQRLDGNHWGLPAPRRTPRRLRKQRQLSVSRSPSQGSPRIRLMDRKQIPDSPLLLSRLTSPSMSSPSPLPNSSGLDMTWWDQVWPRSGQTRQATWSQREEAHRRPLFAQTHRETSRPTFLYMITFMSCCSNTNWQFQF